MSEESEWQKERGAASAFGYLQNLNDDDLNATVVSEGPDSENEIDSNLPIIVGVPVIEDYYINNNSLNRNSGRESDHDQDHIDESTSVSKVETFDISTPPGTESRNNSNQVNEIESITDSQYYGRDGSNVTDRISGISSNADNNIQINDPNTIMQPGAEDSVHDNSSNAEEDTEESDDEDVDTFNRNFFMAEGNHSMELNDSTIET